MKTIASLKPNISCEAAARQFQCARLSAFWRGPLRSLALVYIPFRLFRVEIANGDKRETRWLAQDMVSGTFDPYLFDAALATNQLDQVATRNQLAASLSPQTAQEMLRTKVCRSIFGRGFFRLRDFKIEVRPSDPEFYVPYWAGFRGSGSKAQLAVIDAVRGQLEGARVRRLLSDWLQQ